MAKDENVVSARASFESSPPTTCSYDEAPVALVLAFCSLPVLQPAFTGKKQLVDLGWVADGIATPLFAVLTDSRCCCTTMDAIARVHVYNDRVW